MPDPLSNTRLESDLEAFFRKRVRLLGGYTLKLAPTESGVPDRLVVFPGGHIYLVELKTERGALSAIQRVWHERMLSKWGVRVHVLYGREDVVRWLRAVVTRTAPPSRRKPGPRPRNPVR